MQTSTGQRLSEVFQEKGLSYTGAAREIRKKYNVTLSEATIRRIMADDNTGAKQVKETRTKNLQVLCDYLQINLKWLLTGKGEKELNREANQTNTDDAMFTERLKAIENRLTIMNEILATMIEKINKLTDQDLQKKSRNTAG